MFMDVTDEGGKIVKWAVEFAGSALRRNQQK